MARRPVAAWPPQAQFYSTSWPTRLRELTRPRTNFVREKVNLANRLQKVLENANIKLASVATEVLGASGRAILRALIEGRADPTELAELARGRLRDKREQLASAPRGHVQPHQRFVLTELLGQIESLDEVLRRFDEQMAEYLQPFEATLELLDTIPGIARPTAQVILAEMGTDMSRFLTAGHLAAWAGVAPGTYESAGKRQTSKARKGNRPLCVALVQAANGAARTKHTYLSAQYHRLAARRGHRRAILAVAHSILVIAYYLIRRPEPYRELGADFFDRRRPDVTARRLVKRLEQLGFQVSLQAA